MHIFKIACIGIVGVLLALQLKSGSMEYSVYVSVAVSLLILWSMSGILTAMVRELSTITGMIKIDSVFIRTMFKMLGVIYIAEFASGICRDAGYQTIAVQIEIFAKLTLLVLGMPVVGILMETIKEFLD